MEGDNGFGFRPPGIEGEPINLQGCGTVVAIVPVGGVMQCTFSFSTCSLARLPRFFAFGSLIGGGANLLTWVRFAMAGDMRNQLVQSGGSPELWLLIVKIGTLVSYYTKASESGGWSRLRRDTAEVFLGFALVDGNTSGVVSVSLAGVSLEGKSLARLRGLESETSPVGWSL